MHAGVLRVSETMQACEIVLFFFLFALAISVLGNTKGALLILLFKFVVDLFIMI